MSDYSASVQWARSTHELFLDNQYSRGHTWTFDGGAVVAASAAPDVVPLPYSVAANVDPEEAFIASLASCHMLFFLAIAAKQKWVVDTYCDNAAGVLAKNAEGKMAMTLITLKPKVTFGGDHQPTVEQIQKIHHQAHERCFIANSVKTEVKVLPQ